MFGLTATILLLFSVITYLIIFTLLPHTYKNYKQNELEREVDSFIARSYKLSNEDVEKKLLLLQKKTNAFLTIHDKSGHMLFPQLYSVGQGTPFTELQPSQLPPSAISTTTSNLEEMKESETRKLTRSLIYKGEHAQLIAVATYEPIGEASKVLVLLAPYVLIFIVIASIGGSFFFTLLITRPIRKITASAIRMADLQLDTRIPVQSSDEIGRLAISLNTMTAKLKGSIDDLSSTNKQLQLEMKREREVEARRRELFAAVSHELKSPLTIMKGQLEGMLYQIGIYADRDIYLEKTLQVAENMETLISDILRVSRSDQLKLSDMDEDVCIREIVDDLLAKYEELGLQSGVSLRSSVSSHLQIRTDKKLLETALNNVIHNAIMYTNAGEKVVISAEDQAGPITIEVLNTGARIDEAIIDRIFEPFYRIEQSRSRNTGGSGLGLYITKNILQQLDIAINVSNTPEGVVFSLHFSLDKINLYQSFK